MSDRSVGGPEGTRSFLIEEEAVQTFHNHSTSADDVLVKMFYTEKPEKEKKPRKPESEGS